MRLAKLLLLLHIGHRRHVETVLGLEPALLGGARRALVPNALGLRLRLVRYQQLRRLLTEARLEVGVEGLLLARQGRMGAALGLLSLRSQPLAELLLVLPRTPLLELLPLHNLVRELSPRGGNLFAQHRVGSLAGGEVLCEARPPRTEPLHLLEQPLPLLLCRGAHCPLRMLHLLRQGLCSLLCLLLEPHCFSQHGHSLRGS